MICNMYLNLRMYDYMISEKLISPMKVSDISPWLGPRQLLVDQERSKSHKIKMSTNSAAISVSSFINHNFVEALKALPFVGSFYSLAKSMKFLLCD